MDARSKFARIFGHGSDFFGFWGIGGISAIFAGIGTVWAYFNEKAPKDMTSVGWLFVFLLAAGLAIGVLVLAAWAVQFIKQPLTPTVAPDAQLQRLPPRPDAGGFDPEWPDAIWCRQPMPGTRSPNDNAEVVFYFSKFMGGRSNVGRVAVYFHAGGFNSVEEIQSRTSDNHARPHNEHRIGYAPSEVWFRVDKTRAIVRPQDFRQSTMDGQDEIYAKQFRDVFDFGGNTMPEIIRNGRAYRFAQQIKPQ
jgi:hypothetical protein